MPVFGAADLQQLLNDTGVSVTLGAVTAKGVLDSADEEMLRETFPVVQGRVRVVRVVTGTFALARNASITVDGVGYKVHAFLQIGDGAYTLVTVVSL